MKNNKGFSLVELIVVIAIMAILAAVAVIGVSVYIPKAQQASDKQLISDIEYALTLAGYDTFEEGDGGYIILSTDGVLNAEEIKNNNPNLAEVLKNTFGENWDTDMKLAYDNWGVNGALFGLKKAQAVADSTFVNEFTPDELLGHVQSLTKAAGNILNAQVDSREEMMSFFGPVGGGSNAIEEVAADLGITDIDSLNDEEFINLLVLGAAQDVASGDTPSQAGNIVTNFALYTSFAKTNEAFATEYEKFLTNIQNDSSIENVASEYNKLKDLVEDGGSCESAFATYSAEKGETDLDAFRSMMTGLYGATSSNGDLINDNLNDADMFTTGVGNELFVGYLDSVDAAVNVGEDMNTIFAEIANHPGSIGIIFSRGSEVVSVTNTIE